MIILVLKLFFAYALAIAIGYLLLSLLDRQRAISEGLKIFAGALVGMGVFTLEIFTVLGFGAKVSLGWFLGVGVADVVILGMIVFFPFLARRGKKGEVEAISAVQPLPSPGERGTKYISIIIFSILLLKILASFWQVTHVPTYEFDAWNNWNLRPKVIFTDRELPLDKNSPFYLGGGIKSYPLNDGLWKVFLASLAGSWNEQAVNTAPVFYYIFLLGTFYFALEGNLGRLGRLGGTYLLASLPFLYFHSWIPYTDLLFAAYLFLAGVGIYRYLVSAEQERVWLWVSAVGLAMAIWTKNEGFAVALPVIFVIVTFFSAAKKWSMRDYLRYWLVVVVVSAPWLLFKFINKLDLLSGDSSSFKIAFNEQFVREWFLSVFIRSHFNFLWLLLFLLLIFKFKKIWQAPQLRYLCLLIGLLFLFYNGIILFTDKAYDLSALVRVNLHLAPLGLLAVLEIMRREFLDKLS